MTKNLWIQYITEILLIMIYPCKQVLVVKSKNVYNTPKHEAQ